MSELEDRCQRAREAYRDTVSSPALATDVDPVDVFAEALDAAIETATRVRVTPEIVAAYRARRIELSLDAIGGPGPVVDMDALIKGALEAAFEAAGFEVEP